MCHSLLSHLSQSFYRVFFAIGSLGNTCIECGHSDSHKYFPNLENSDDPDTNLPYGNCKRKLSLLDFTGAQLASKTAFFFRCTHYAIHPHSFEKRATNYGADSVAVQPGRDCVPCFSTSCEYSSFDILWD